MVDKVAFEFNPFEETGIEVPKEKRKEALEAVKDYVLEQELLYIGEGKSPVAGGRWKRSLSPAYKERKSEESSVDYANLELSGEMLDALEIVPSGKGKDWLSLQIEGDQAGKAEGNNLGTYGNDSPVSTPREFIPKKNQTFRRAIWDGIKNILEEFEE